MATTFTDSLDVEISDLEVTLDQMETRRLDLPVDAVAERITLRQTQRELEAQLAQLKRRV